LRYCIAAAIFRHASRASAARSSDSTWMHT
jgi:hypothetical protein